MKNLLIADLRRAFFSRRFVASLLVYIGSFLVNLLFNVYRSGQAVSGAWNIYFFSTGFGLNVFHVTAPIATVLSCGWLYLDSRKSGYIKHELLRSTLREYSLSKLYACCICSSASAFIGHIIILVICFALDPSSSLRILNATYLVSFSRVYLNSLLGYGVLHIINGMLFSIAYACMALAASALLNNTISLIIPLLWHVIFFLISSSTNVHWLSVLLPAGSPALFDFPEWKFIYDYCVIFAGSLIGYFIAIKKDRSDMKV